MIIVVDQYQKAKTILSNSSPKALGYFGDHHREQLDGLLTYEFSTLASHPSAVHLIAGNSIIVRNLDKALMKFQILRTEEEQEDGKYVKRVYAENSAVGDLHGVIVKGTLLKSIGLSQAATHALQGTGWQLGRVEYAGLKDVDFSEYPTALAALYKIRDIYELELEFSVHFDGVKVREQFVHFVKRRGQNTRKRFTYGKDLKGVSREEDRTDLVTALVGVGKADEQGNRLTFADYEATHSGYFKPKGQDWVGDDEALQKYGNNGKHIFGRFELSSVDNVYELLDKTAAELKKVCKPRMTYTVSVVLLERLTKLKHEKVRLGDTIIVKDTTFEPALIVEARVLELIRSYTDPSEDSVLLGEFVPIFVDKNKQIEAIQQQINSNISKWEAKGETVIKSVNEPTNKTPDMLWLDLNLEPNVMKRWDDTAKRWVKASATTAEEIGAETPTGAQNKANTAQSNAAKDATEKANNAIDTASKDATNKANQAKDDAVQIAGDDATNKADAAEEAAKSYADGVVESVEAAMKEHAEQVAKDAEEAAQIFTEQYAQKELHIGNTAPADTTRLWLDTTNKLNVLKRYNPTTKVWDAATPTTAGELGAETPAGAKAKADAAQKAAEAAASTLAKAEAALAETNAKAHADNVVTAEEEARIKQAEENLAAAKKEAADKAAAAETAAKQAAALDATGKANAARDAAITEAQKKATAAETAAKTYADTITATIEANANKHADDRAQAAQDAAKVFTESYAQKEIKIQNTPPTDTTVLWLDTTKEPNIMKRYDLLAKKWVDASPTNASQIGAETPSGAQSKADAAKNSAVSTAAADALAKANAAQAAAIAAAAADAKTKADAAQKAATDRANTVENTVKAYANDATNITKGTIAADRLYGGTIDAQKANIVNISAGSITTGQLDASIVTVINLNASNITAGTLSAARLAAGTITADKIAAKAITADKMAVGTITAASGIISDISASTITAGTLDASKVTVANLSATVLQAGIIDASKVTINNLDASKITAGTLSADKIKGGSIDANNVTINNINAGKIVAGTLDASKVTVTNLNAGNITAGVLSAARLDAGTITADKLHVLAKNLINNPSRSKNFTGWIINKNAGSTYSMAVDAERGQVVKSDAIVDPTTFESDFFEVDPNQTYKVNLGIKIPVNPSTGAQYFGMKCYDENKVEIPVTPFNHSSKVFEADRTNTYFWSGTNLFASWNDMEAYILAAHIAQPAEVAAAKNVSHSYRMNPKTRYVRIRFYNGYYSKDVTQVATTYFYSPSIQAVDSGSLTAERIVAGTLDASKVNVTNLSASNITAGTLDAGKVTVTNLSASVIQTGVLDAAKVTVNNLSAARITSGTMSADRILGGTIDATKITVTNLNASNINSGTLNADKVEVSNGKVTINSSGVTVTDADFMLRDSKSGTLSSAVVNTNLMYDHSFELLIPNFKSTPVGGFYYDVDWLSISDKMFYRQWGRVGTPKMLAVGATTLPPQASLFGEYSILVNSGNYVLQEVDVLENQVYTASFHAAKPLGGLAGGAPKIIVEFYKDGILSSSATKDFAVPNTSVGDNVRYSYSFTVPAALAGGSAKTVRIKLLSTNTNWAVLDGVQLVLGSKPAPYVSEDTLYRAMKGTEVFKKLVGEEGVIDKLTSSQWMMTPKYFGTYPKDPMLCDHENGNVTVNGGGSNLMLGYWGTTQVRSEKEHAFQAGVKIVGNNTNGNALDISSGHVNVWGYDVKATVMKAGAFVFNSHSKIPVQEEGTMWFGNGGAGKGVYVLRNGDWMSWV